MLAGFFVPQQPGADQFVIKSQGVSDQSKVLENSLKSSGCKEQNRRNTVYIPRLSNAADAAMLELDGAGDFSDTP